MRPQIKPGLRAVWRSPGSLQIGLTPGRGVVLDGLGPDDAELIARLDGTHERAALVSWAASRGGSTRAKSLLSLLDQAGVLVGAPTDRAHLGRLSVADRVELRPDADAWSVAYGESGDGYEVLARRRRRSTLVVGEVALAGLVAAALAGTGLATRQVARLAHRPPGPPPDLLVLVAEDDLAALDTATLVQAGLPHLAVVAAVDRVGVGPLVLPGRSPCLRCVHLQRRDRDPAWPDVAGQLREPPPVRRGERTLQQLAASLAALQAAAWADARRTPEAVGATLTLALPDGLPVRRQWRAHPSCGCGWLAASRPADMNAGVPR